MGQLSITLVRADTNQEFDVELPDDAPVSELLPALVKELGLPLTGPDGNPVAYEIANKRNGKGYQGTETLASAGTKGGDNLLLTSTFVAGGLRETSDGLDARDAASIALHEHLHGGAEEVGCTDRQCAAELRRAIEAGNIGYARVRLVCGGALDAIRYAIEKSHRG